VFGWPVVTVLPAYTKLRLGLKEEAYSFLLSSLGAGALAAALATATFGSVPRRGAFMLVGVALCAAGIAGLGFANVAWVANGCCAAIGCGMILFLATGQSTLQLAVPNEVRGRVMAVWAMTLSASAPLGHLLVGELVKEYEVGPVLFGMAACVGVVAVLFAGMLAARRLGEPRPQGRGRGA
jgi:MFS family permease